MNDSKSVYSAETAVEKWLELALDSGVVEIDGYEYKPEPNLKFGNVDSIKPYVDQVTTKLGLSAVRVVRRQGAAKATYRWGEIRIPDYTIGGHWALAEMTVLHELAHHIDPASHEHGKNFREAFVKLLKDIGKPVTAELLELAYERAGVGTLGHTVPESTLDKIGKLLRQAEGASTEEERVAFNETAQRLATKYSVSLAVARARQSKTEKRETPMVKQFEISVRGKHGNAERVILADSIANANDVKITIYNGNYRIDMYGFESDIEIAKAMYESVAAQMEIEFEKYMLNEPVAYKEVRYRKWFRTEELNESEYNETSWARIISQGGSTEWVTKKEKVHGLSRRMEFYSAFALTVSRRLRELKKEMREEQEADPEWSEETALAVRGKEVEVTDFFKSKFTSKRKWSGASYRSGGSSATNAGRQAGNNASFGTEKRITS